MFHLIQRRLSAMAMVAALVAGCGATGSSSPTASTPSTSPTPATSAVPSTPPSPAPSPSPAPATASPLRATPTLPAPTLVPTPGTSLPPFACGEVVQQAGSVPIAHIRAFTVVNDAATGRITFTFFPEGNVAAVPDIVIRPTEPPFMRDPSGLPLAVAGNQFLEIVLQGGTALDANFEPTFEGPFDVTPGGKPIVEVKRAGDFEAVSTYVVGLSGRPCVRILPPDGTGRLVIEVQARISG